MITVHILTTGFKAPNSRTLLMPLRRHAHALAERGLRFVEHTALGPAVAECDLLIIDSKFFRDWWAERTTEARDIIANLRQKSARIYFFDTTDSTGFINSHVLDLVDLYYKNQVLRDRSLYGRPLYGRRLFTDWYHREFGVHDTVPDISSPIAETDWARICVSWNSYYGNYDFSGLYLLQAYAHLPWSPLLRWPVRYHAPEAARPLGLSCRMGTNYDRESVAFQRRQVRDLLAHLIPSDRLSRKRYFREMERARLVLSPFGFGEINYKDYEAFISGALLVKPDMGHLETWPDFYRDDAVLTFKWDFSDLEQVLNTVLEDPVRCVAMARSAQDRYRFYRSSTAGTEAFCDRVAEIVAGTPVSPAASAR